jgi:uncharacterized protein (DUF302 family)
MHHFTTFFTLLLLTLFTLSCSTKSPSKSLKHSPKTTQHNILIYSSSFNNNITPESIEEHFNKLNLKILTNNNMNTPFKKYFNKLYYNTYNIAIYFNQKLSYKLLKKYPKFSLLTPLSIAIYKNSSSINIATLSLQGMAKITQIPQDDQDLIAYANLIQKALKSAMPNAHVKELAYTQNKVKTDYTYDFKIPLNISKNQSYKDYIEEFEAKFEAEMEQAGFLLPNYMDLQEEIFHKYSYKAYDIYHTYSICKLDTIYQLSKQYPEAGALSPSTLYIYKKKNEKNIHIGFLGEKNWITLLNIQDKQSIKLLKDTQAMIIKILDKLTQ